MILLPELLYELDQRLNKLSTNTHQEIPPEDKLLALNNAQNTLILNKIDGNNVFKIGYDGFKKRYQDLQFLAEPYEKHTLQFTVADPKLNKYIALLEDVSPKFMFFLGSYLIASKGSCKNRIINCNPNPVKHQDIFLLLQDTNYKPSFEYQETLCSLSSDLLEVYTDGTFTIDSGALSYIRYPKKMRLEGEDDFDGVPETTVDCELPSYLKEELLNYTVLNLGFPTENSGAVQAAQAKLSQE